jgi:hypothetical protein
LVFERFDKVKSSLQRIGGQDLTVTFDDEAAFYPTSKFTPSSMHVVIARVEVAVVGIVSKEGSEVLDRIFKVDAPGVSLNQ